MATFIFLTWVRIAKYFDDIPGGMPAKYYEYSGGDLGEVGILGQGEVSDPRSWELELNGALEFQFSALISTVVPDPGAIGVHITRVSAGSGHVCGDGADGKVYCWGVNDKGHLGDGTLTNHRTPTVVAAARGR